MIIGTGIIVGKDELEMGGGNFLSIITSRAKNDIAKKFIKEITPTNKYIMSFGRVSNYEDTHVDSVTLRWRLNYQELGNCLTCEHRAMKRCKLSNLSIKADDFCSKYEKEAENGNRKNKQK